MSIWGDGTKAPEQGEIITAEFLRALYEHARQHGAFGEGMFSGIGFAARRRLARAGGVRFAWATTTGNVVTTDVNFQVTDVVSADGRAVPVDADPMWVKNDPDEYEIASGVRGKIIYCYDDDDEWAWHPLDFPC